jgi:chromosome transmission fidelity protein 18
MKEMIAHQVKLESFRQKDDKPISSISSKSPTVFKESQRTSPTSVVDQTRNKDVESQQAVNKPPKTAAVPSSTPRKLIARKLDDIALSVPLPKRIKTSPKSTSKNFLGIGAKRAKQAQSARKKAAVGLTSSKKNKLAHTGSGFRLNQVIRLRYVKGFTQAVRTPCRQKDLE